MARLAGRLSDWNDEKGYGFVVPNGGGERCFVHVHDFPRGTRRPVEGDLISYVATLDPRGRPKAREARLAGQPAATKSTRAAQPVTLAPRRLPRIVAGCTALGLVGAFAALAWIPVEIAAAYGFFSVISLLAYGVDKAAARRGEQRVPESGLHLLDLLGGWPGALVAQGLFRHKTIKRSFQVGFAFTVVANLAIVGWLLRPAA